MQNVRHYFKILLTPLSWHLCPHRTLHKHLWTVLDRILERRRVPFPAGHGSHYLSTTCHFLPTTLPSLPLPTLACLPSYLALLPYPTYTCLLLPYPPSFCTTCHAMLCATFLCHSLCLQVWRGVVGHGRQSEMALRWDERGMAWAFCWHMYHHAGVPAARTCTTTAYYCCRLPAYPRHIPTCYRTCWEHSHGRQLFSYAF